MKLSEKSIHEMRADLLEITPEIIAILEDIGDAQKSRSDNNSVRSGPGILEDYVNMALVRRYDGIIKILSVIYKIPPKDLALMSVLEVVSMVEETLSDALLMRFFPQLRRLGLKTQSAL